MEAGSASSGAGAGKSKKNYRRPNPNKNKGNKKDGADAGGEKVVYLHHNPNRPPPHIKLYFKPKPRHFYINKYNRYIESEKIKFMKKSVNINTNVYTLVEGTTNKTVRIQKVSNDNDQDIITRSLDSYYDTIQEKSRMRRMYPEITMSGNFHNMSYQYRKDWSSIDNKRSVVLSKNTVMFERYTDISRINDLEVGEYNICYYGIKKCEKHPDENGNVNASVDPDTFKTFNFTQIKVHDTVIEIQIERMDKGKYKEYRYEANITYVKDKVRYVDYVSGETNKYGYVDDEFDNIDTLFRLVIKNEDLKFFKEIYESFEFEVKFS